LRIGVDGVDVMKSILQDDPRSVVPHQVVQVSVIWPRRSLFSNGIKTPILYENIVGYDGVIINYAPWGIAIPYNNSTTIPEDKIIRNYHIVSGMPELNPKARIAIGNIIVNVATEIGMIDTRYKGAWGRIIGSDIMDYISDDVIIAAVGSINLTTSSKNSGPALIGASRGNIMHVVSDDSHKCAIILKSNSDVAADIESHNVYVISVVGPHRIGAAAP
jgi:hypothetical protein